MPKKKKANKSTTLETLETNDDKLTEFQFAIYSPLSSQKSIFDYRYYIHK